MKKILTFMLCLGVASAVMAKSPTPISLAKDAKTIEEKRSKIKDAIALPDYANSPEAYFEAGEIELGEYGKDVKRRASNVNDSTIALKMADELIQGYNYYMQALPFDNKGDITKKITNKISKNKEGFFDAGVDYYKAQKFFPEAYNAFMIYGELPEGILKNEANKFSIDQLQKAFYNAGVMASSANQMEESADAYRKSRLLGNDTIDVYRYELGALLSIGQEDEAKANDIKDRIIEVAKAGVDKFGPLNPIFINNYINAMVNDNQNEQALEILNGYIAEYPENSNLYGLRGWLYEQMENDDLSEADYRKGAEVPQPDFGTLKNAALKIFKIGTKKNEAIEGDYATTYEPKKDLKHNYFMVALQYAQEADKLQPGDPSVESIIDGLNYALETYFINID